MAFDAGQREQRQKARNDDRGSKEDAAADVTGRMKDSRESRGTAGGDPTHADRVRAICHAPKDRLDHDDRRVDDEPEIERTERQEVGALALQSQNQDSD